MNSRSVEPDENTKSRLPGIKQPTLIMWGRHDTWIVPQAAELFHEYIPNSKLIFYDNAAHVPMEEIPDKSCADAL